MSKEFEVKVIDGNEAQKENAGLRGQGQDTGPKEKMHHHMMMHSSDSSGSFVSSNGSESSGSLSSLSSGNSFSESLSLSSESSGSESGSLSSSSVSSGSGSFSSGFGSFPADGAPGQRPKERDDGFAVPNFIRRHRKRRKRHKHHNKDTSSDSSSNSLSSSGSSFNESSSGSVEASSNIDAHRTKDLGRVQKMMKRKHPLNLQPAPGLAKELHQYIAGVNMQVPDIGGQAPIDTTATPAPQTVIVEGRETSLKAIRRKKQRKRNRLKKKR